MRARGGAGAAAAAVAVGAVLVLGLVAGCDEQRPSLEPPAAASPPPSASVRPTQPAAEPTVAQLPGGPLRDQVPAPQEVPEGLVPLLQASGPRDAAAVAAFSADAAVAAEDLARHGFTDAYVAQYASATDPRSLTVVAVRFASPEGARDDLAGDLAVGGGELVETATIGEASEVRRLPLPDDDAQDLITVRFRVGSTTWLLAWRAPLPGDAAIPVGLARTLAGRG